METIYSYYIPKSTVQTWPEDYVSLIRWKLREELGVLPLYVHSMGRGEDMQIDIAFEEKLSIDVKLKLDVYMTDQGSVGKEPTYKFALDLEIDPDLALAELENQGIKGTYLGRGTKQIIVFEDLTPEQQEAVKKLWDTFIQFRKV